jgi:hypothetical protein
VVKAINMKNKLVGWDSAAYRADKLKLGLVDDPFDLVSFESSMAQNWTRNDEAIIERLKDKYMNVQAIELNILTFEKTAQENKEGLGEYLMRLRRLVKEAYDGNSQTELDKRVAWRFVSGVQDKRITKKLMESGWMEDRYRSKPLEELLRIAEVTKQTDDAVEILDKEKSSGSVNMFQSEIGSVAAVGRFSENRRTFRQKSSSGESNSSMSGRSSGSSLPLEMYECWYCKRQHRGGWFYCSKRKKENPRWKPNRSDSSKAKTGFRQ